MLCSLIRMRFSYGIISILTLINFLNLVSSTPNTTPAVKYEESLTIHPLQSEQEGILKERNTTFSLVQPNSADTLIIELSLITSLGPTNSIIFGASAYHALFFNIESNSYNGDVIDSRGYFMRKLHYRIELNQKDNNSNNNHSSQSNQLDPQKSTQFFVTIFQNGGPVQQLKYSMKIKMQNPQSSDKLCPFDCLNKGICQKEVGKCLCNSGFVDYDCSKPSIDLSSFKNVTDDGMWSVDWNINFYPNDARFYFLKDSLDIKGYLVLQVQQTQTNLEDNKSISNCGNLEVYYSPETKELNCFGVADRHFSKTAKLIKGQKLSYPNIATILLDKIEARDQIERELLFGFRHTGETSCSVTLKIFMTQNFNTDDGNIGFLEYIKQNEVLISMIVLIFILLIILCVLLVWLRRNSLFIEETEETRLMKNKQKQLLKMKQFESLFELIPQLEYNETLPLFDQLIKSQTDPPSCSICLCDFEKNDHIRVTYCPHFFHTDCLKQWLLKQKNCPHCRNDLSLITLQKQEPSHVLFLANPSIQLLTQNEQQILQKQQFHSPHKSKQNTDLETNSEKHQFNGIANSIEDQIPSNILNNQLNENQHQDDNNNILISDFIPLPIPSNTSGMERKIHQFKQLYTQQYMPQVDEVEISQETSIHSPSKKNNNHPQENTPRNSQSLPVEEEGEDIPKVRRLQSGKNTDREDNMQNAFNIRGNQILGRELKSSGSIKLRRLQSNLSNDGQDDSIGTIGDQSFKASSQQKLKLPAELTQIQQTLGKSIFSTEINHPNISSF